ncbi:acyl-CoA dehydrogenase family protein [bacterium]|nr:acyl-CoA dehydrogenase family protein [bacterium]
MDWLGLNNDHKLLRDDIAGFAKNELEEDVLEFDKEYKFFDSVWKKAAGMGLFGFMLPESVGGADMDAISLALCIEELAVVSPSFAFAVAVQNIGAYAIEKFGGMDNKADIVKDIVKGLKVALCMESICKLKCNDDRTQISGTSGFVVNGDNSKYCLMFASCAERNTYLYLDTADNCEFHKENEIIGMRSAGIGKFEVKPYAISDKNFLQPDEGEIEYLLKICVSAVSTGICAGSYNVAIPYSKERVQFGRPISKFGMVRRMVSEIEENARISRLLTYDAASKFRDGDRLAPYIASVTARDRAMVCGDRAVQVLGGAGYTKDYPAEMYFRDAKTLEALLYSAEEERELIGKIITD